MTHASLRRLELPISTPSSASSARPTRPRGRGRCSPASSPSPARSRSAPSNEDDDLVGYLVLSRYVDAWHVMNLAVEPEWRRRGIASALLERLLTRRGTTRARLHAGGARLQRRGDPAVRALRLPRARRATRLLHRQPRGRPGHVARPGAGARRCGGRWRCVILGIETSCDETAAARRRRRRRGALVGRRLAGGPARPLRRRRARGRVAAAPGARRAGHPRGARRRRAVGLDDVDRVGGHARARPGRRAARRHLGRQGDRLGTAAAARPGRPPRTGTSRRSPSRRRRSSLRSSACSRAAATRCCSPSRHGRASSGSERRSTTPPARRSTRARGCSGSGTRGRGDRPARAEGDPDAFSFPVARVPGLDFSFSGLKTALLYAVRDLGDEELEARRADLAASYQRAIVRALVERLRAGCRADAASRRLPSSAASPRTRSCAPRCRRPASHRSRSAPTTRP